MDNVTGQFNKKKFNKKMTTFSWGAGFNRKNVVTTLPSQGQSKYRNAFSPVIGPRTEFKQIDLETKKAIASL